MASPQQLLKGPIHTALLSLAIPIVLAQLLQAAYQLIDAFWVGRLGANEVAAVSISTPVTFLVIAIGAGLAMAGATLTAQYIGAKQMDKVNHVAGQTMLMVFITSIVLGTIGYFLTPSFLTLLGVEEAVYENALQYMRVSFISIIFVFTYNMFQALMRGTGEVKISLYIVLVTVLLNLVLDPIFIFGFGPIEGLGVAGAALATLVTQALAAITGCYILSKGKHGIHLKWKDLSPDWTYIKRAFFLGAPASVELSARALGLITMSFLVASFGTVTIASYGVGSNILLLITIPAMGLSMAVSTLVGQNLGANQVERASKVTIIGSVWSFVMLTLIGVIAYFMAPTIVQFFIPNDPAVIEQGSQFLKMMCLSWGCIGIQLSIMSAFRASGNMMNSMVLSLLTQWVFQFPLAFILSKHTYLQEQGIWVSFTVTNILIAAISAMWFARGSWKKTRLIGQDEIEILSTAEETLIEVGEKRA